MRLRMIRHICLALAGASVAIACGSNAMPTTQPDAAQTVRVTLAEWSVQAVSVKVKAGPVLFAVTNASMMMMGQQHEMVAIVTDLDPAKLPRITATQPPVEGHVVGGEYRRSPSPSFAESFSPTLPTRHFIVHNYLQFAAATRVADNDFRPHTDGTASCPRAPRATPPGYDRSSRRRDRRQDS